MTEALCRASSNRPRRGLEALIWLRWGRPAQPLCCLLPCVCVAMVARGTAVGNQLPCPSLPLVAEASGCSSCLPFGSHLSPEIPGVPERGIHLHLRVLGAPLRWADRPNGRCWPRRRWLDPTASIPLATGHLRGDDGLGAAISSSGKFPGPKWGQKKSHSGGKTRSGVPASWVPFSALPQSVAVTLVISLVSSVPQFS